MLHFSNLTVNVIYSMDLKYYSVTKYLKRKGLKYKNINLFKYITNTNRCYY